MSDEERENPGFTVVDKRGRSEEDAPEDSAAEARAQELPKADFSTFLLSLAAVMTPAVAMVFLRQPSRQDVVVRILIALPS